MHKKLMKEDNSYLFRQRICQEIDKAMATGDPSIPGTSDIHVVVRSSRYDILKGKENSDLQRFGNPSHEIGEVIDGYGIIQDRKRFSGCWQYTCWNNLLENLQYYTEYDPSSTAHPNDGG